MGNLENKQIREKGQSKEGKNNFVKNPNIYMLLAVVAGVIILAIVFLGSSNNNNSTNSNSNYTPPTYEPSPNPTDKTEENIPNKKVYGFDETFEFDGLEITIGSNYAFDTVKNKYSDFNNQTAVKLPVTVKNISSETHSLNMFYYDVYGSYGTKAERLGSYFDDNLDHAGNLRSSASYTKFMYFLYDGDGTYAIELDNFSEEITVEFTITKN